MAIKLYPPQLEGTLPAFYKKYEVDPLDIDKKVLKGASIQIPFGMNRLVNETLVNGISCRVRTIATNTYLIVKDIEKSLIDFTNGVAYLRLDATEANKLKEGLYYKIQLAYIGTNNTVGYYSTVGVIKCVAKPTVEIHGFSTDTTNQLNNELIGVYILDYSFGDSTEKVYSYNFVIWNEKDEILDETGEVVHDSTLDVSSFSSRDIFKTYKTLSDGVVGFVLYTITTMNKLTMSSPKYQVMKAATIEMDSPVKLIASTNYDNGYILLNLEGDVTTDATNTVHEAICSGTFVIYRASDLDDYIEHEEITRFVIDAGYPSDYYFRDYTVLQGINYRYFIQQYNINKVYSNEIASLNRRPEEPYVLYNEPTKADFEDMFLYDGYRQLKIRFNPKVDSFKNSIPELKIETIGSKYPFIFRNGNVCYKEFPIAGLVSFLMDESTLFLNSEELKLANILERDLFRIATNVDAYLAHKNWKHDLEYEYPVEKLPIYDKYLDNVIVGYKTIYHKQPLTDTQLQKLIHYDIASEYNSLETGWNDYTDIIRSNRDLTTENMMSERYFKLKVLDWLTDGKVKLFRSPGEGNYLVRLLNVSMKPKDPLGRMLHDFTCTGYEIAALTYNNLVYYNIVHNNTPNIMEMHWASLDLRDIQGNLSFYDSDGWLILPLDDASVQSFLLTNFVPGDKVRIRFSNDIEDNTVIFTIGPTGTFNYDYDERTIYSIELLLVDEPYKDFDRNIIYSYPGLLLTKFDTISDIRLHTLIAEEFVGPKENLLEHYDLLALLEQRGTNNALLTHDLMVDVLFNNLKIKDNINYYLNKDVKFTLLSLDLIKVRKRPLIPIYLCEDMDYDELTSEYYPKETSKYEVTPFGIGYVNNKMITRKVGDNFLVIQTVDVVASTSSSEVINALDISEVTKHQTYLNRFANYKNENLLLNKDFAVLLLFVPKLEDNRYIWVPSEREDWKYYDTYFAKWWPGLLEYEPVFCVNDIDLDCTVQKAEMYNENIDTYEPTYIESDMDSVRRADLMPNLKADTLERAYRDYKEDLIGYKLLDDTTIYDENGLYFTFNSESNKPIKFTYVTTQWDILVKTGKFYKLRDINAFLLIESVEEGTEEELEEIYDNNKYYYYYDAEKEIYTPFIYTNIEEWVEYILNNNLYVLLNDYENNQNYYQLLDKESKYDYNDLYFILNNDNKFIPYTNILDRWDNEINHNNLYKLVDETNWISVDNIEEITLYKLGKVNKITLGSGVMADITAQLQVVDYLIEDTDARVREMKMDYKGTDAAGNAIGEYANFQNALHSYMTKALQIEDARDELAEKLERRQLLIELQELYIEERGSITELTGIPQFLHTIKSIIESYHRRLFVNIQGANSLIDDSYEYEGSLNQTTFDTMTINTLTYVDKLENSTDFIEIPLDMIEAELVKIYSAKGDRIRLTRISRDENSNEQDIGTLTIKISDDNDNETYTYTAPYNTIVTKIEISKSSTHEAPVTHSREIIIQNYTKRISQIGDFLANGTYPTGNENETLPFWPADGIIINGYKYKYIQKSDNLPPLIKKIDISTENETEVATYSFRSLSNDYILVPEFINENRDENKIELLDTVIKLSDDGETLSGSYIDLLTAIGRDSAGENLGVFYDILILYSKILDNSHKFVERITGIYNILFNAGLANASGKIKYSTYVPWIIKLIIGQEGNTKIGVIWEIYKLLHYYSTIEEDLYNGDPENPTTWKPLTWTLYKNFLLLGDRTIINNTLVENDDDSGTTEEWYWNKMSYPYLNAAALEESLKQWDERHEHFTISYTPTPNKYLDDNISNSGPALAVANNFLGTIVDAYEDILAKEEEYIAIYLLTADFFETMHNMFPAADIAKWNNLLTQLNAAKQELEKYKMWLYNKDLIDDTALQELIINSTLSTNIDNYLLMKILETLSIIDSYKNKLAEKSSNNHTYEEYLQYNNEYNELNDLKSKKANTLNNSISTYKTLVTQYIELVLFTEADESFRDTMSLKELLDRYDKVRNGNYDSNSIIDDANTDIQNYNKNYNAYKDHIKQLKIDNSRTTVSKYINKIKEYLKIYINSIKLYDVYKTNIDNIENDILQLNEDIRILNLTISNAGEATTSFNDRLWMEKIQTALAKYLVTLAEVYKEKVEDRYNI